MEYTGEDIFDEIASIRDPERPYQTLAELNVVNRDRCFVEYVRVGAGGSTSGEPPTPSASLEDDAAAVARRKRFRKDTALVTVVLRPTVPHCHLMHLICLSVIARLHESLPVTTSWKVRITLVPGSHLQVEEVERQAQDKERVAAAFENPIVAQELRKLINPFGD